MVGGLKIVQVKTGHEAALDFHQKSAHGARYFPLKREIIEKIDVEYFDGVVD
jgi:hypothetical protein